jgi:EmrB/QacA subfamily drug resistance transporter
MAIPKRNLAAFSTVMLAFMMAILDTSIVNITLPCIAEYFKSDIKTVSWVINAFNLAFAVPLITASRLADQFGRKKIFMIGLFLFTLTSFLSGISPSESWLIFFRVLQGLAASMLVPVTLPIVLPLFPEEKSGTVVGVWAAVAGLAAASGPALGGIIADKLAWQWIFYINIPVGFIALVLTAVLIEESFDSTATHYIDWSGMLSLTAGTFALVYALIKANDLGWSSYTILALFFFAALGFVLFVLAERRSKEPMLPLHLLRSLPFSASNLTLFMLGLGMMNGIFTLAFFLTLVMGMSQLKAGIIITALPLASTVFSGIAGLLSDKLGSRWFAAAGMAVMSLSVYLYCGLTPTSTNFEIIWRLMVAGAGIGMALAPLVGATVRSVPSDKVGLASGVGNMTRTIGTVFGVAIIVTIFTHMVEKQFVWAKQEAVKLVSTDTVLRDQIKQPILDGLNRAKFSKSQKMATLEETLAQVEVKEREILSSLQPFMKKKMAAVFEKQKAEIKNLYPKLQGTFKNRICDAFAATFKINSLILLLGIVFALFCEPWKK